MSSAIKVKVSEKERVEIFKNNSFQNSYTLANTKERLRLPYYKESFKPRRETSLHEQTGLKI